MTRTFNTTPFSAITRSGNETVTHLRVVDDTSPYNTTINAFEDVTHRPGYEYWPADLMRDCGMSYREAITALESGAVAGYRLQNGAWRVYPHGYERARFRYRLRNLSAEFARAAEAVVAALFKERNTRCPPPESVTYPPTVKPVGPTSG